MAARHRTPQHRALQSVLQTVRRERGLSQEALAAKLGKPQSFVSKYENGERKLDLVELDAICSSLDIGLETLIRRYRKRSKQE